VANAWAEIQLHKASVAQAFTAANNKINNWLATQGG
jgi:hypothetical protein